jgi:hypothetical protein
LKGRGDSEVQSTAAEASVTSAHGPQRPIDVMRVTLFERKPYRSELASRLFVKKRIPCLHCEEKVGLPTLCIGEMRYYVTRVTAVEEKVPYFILLRDAISRGHTGRSGCTFDTPPIDVTCRVHVDKR